MMGLLKGLCEVSGEQQRDSAIPELKQNSNFPLNNFAEFSIVDCRGIEKSNDGEIHGDCCQEA